MSDQLGEAYVRIRPNLKEFDASLHRLRDLFADVTAAFDTYLARALDGEAERLDEIIDRANQDRDGG